MTSFGIGENQLQPSELRIVAAIEDVCTCLRFPAGDLSWQRRATDRLAVETCSPQVRNGRVRRARRAA